MAQDNSPTPDNATRFADAAVTVTRNITGLDLDYTPETLHHVDRLIDGFRREGHTAGTMTEVVYMFGCYLGEMIIRNHGGQWKRASATRYKGLAADDCLILELPSKAACNPIGKAFKLLENGIGESLWFFYHGIMSPHVVGSDGAPTKGGHDGPSI